MSRRHFLSVALLLAAAFSLPPPSSQAMRMMKKKINEHERNQCVYTIYIQTGSIMKAGTDASISLTLGDALGNSVSIADVRAWGGLMGSGHDYFERGALDIFSARGPCGLAAPICSINVTSDGGGPHHGWFCDYVEVTATGPHKAACMQLRFYVRQWLAYDAPPYRTYASIDVCGTSEPSTTSAGRVIMSEAKRHFVVGG